MLYFTRLSYMVVKRLSLRELSLGGFLEENENGGKTCRDNVHRRYGPFGGIRDTGSGGKDLDPRLELRSGPDGGMAFGVFVRQNGEGPVGPVDHSRRR